MRISLLSSGTVYPLAGEAGVSERTHSSAGDFSLTPESAQEVIRKVRAALAEPVERGNYLTSLAFTTARLFATAAEAWLWALDYDGTTPRSGTLLLDVENATGTVTRRHLTSAVVPPPRRRVVGASVLLDYSAMGSEIVEGGAYATGSVSFTGLPTAGQTVTIGTRIYTWASTLTAADQIKISGSTGGCVYNLAVAINAITGDGVNYGSGTAAHADVSALWGASTVTLTARRPGTAGNSLPLSETSTNLTVSGATLTGGAE